jgi:membrane protein
MNYPALSLKSAGSLLKETASEWLNDNALRLSAALAYYSTFSIAPLLVIALAIAGWIFGREAASGLLDRQLQTLLGGAAAEGVKGLLTSASKPASSVLAGVLGIVALLLGASGVFGQLKDALNTIWEVRKKPGQAISGFIRERLLSFGMVLVIGFLLLVSLLLTAAVSGLTEYFGSGLAGPVLTGLSSLVSFAVVTLLFAAIFKVLPDAKVQWRDVWMGAVVTGLLFEIGKSLLALYLGHQSTSSAYGAATSVVLVLLWVYYASLILFFGAEFTQVYARAHGARIEPNENAEPVTPVPKRVLRPRKKAPVWRWDCVKWKTASPRNSCNEMRSTCCSQVFSAASCWAVV